MEILSEYIVAVVMAICFGTGYVIKHSLSFIHNKYIPLIMAVLGIVINVWANDFLFNPQILLSGMASGLAATGAFEVIRNMGNGNK